ncbi:zinc finger protein 91-like [Galleria mellonella]|uniref:Zinc finger protein 91-like n=1 Tax=Galleria mellonella TaxID=7137 RepID=A0ABM3MA00_GALME|nr:zinc finger protein 91-like [Galleria mellonella]
MEQRICPICLSNDRELQQPTKALCITLKMLTPGLDIQRLCWECMARLKHANVLMFNAVEAKHNLDEYTKGPNYSNVGFKSNLNFSNILTFCLPGESLQICDIHTNIVSKSKFTNSITHIKKVQHSRLNAIKMSDNCVKFLENNNIREKRNITEIELVKDKKRNVMPKKITCKRRNRLRMAKNEYKCKECSKIFESRGKYEYHRQKHRGGAQCPTCSCVLASNAALVAHRRAKHARLPQREDANFYCQPCGKFFKTSCSYRKHQRTANKHLDVSTLKYPCPNCDKRFTSTLKAKLHNETVHLRMNLFMCEVCNKRYCSERALSGHKRRKHSTDTRTRCFICETCGSRLKTYQILKRHLQTHLKEQDKSKGLNKI